MQITKDTVVTIDYTLTGQEGAVIDSSEGHEPLAYLHGHGAIIPGLESALTDKSPGDSVETTLSPEEGYGARDEKLVQSVPRAKFEAAGEIKPGMQFQAQTPEGTRIFTVVRVENDQVTLDSNHPLAGQTLHFKVKVVGVRKATEEELAHGHVHGPGGHHH